jgi:16S rRNA (uracil1498-N3)-methyltransferase
LIIFYTKQLSESEGWLVEEEFHHCVHVLRKNVGDNIYVTNGIGLLYKCTISEVKKDKLLFNIVNIESSCEKENEICIAISPTKSSDRIEWFLEKAVEIGINNIAFVNFHRTERFKLNEVRLNKIALSAMKQSLQLHLTKLHFIKNTAAFESLFYDYEIKLVANCDENHKVNINRELVNGKSSIILIGPEGDFTKEELDYFLSKNFKSISLGKTRLRTETAGIVAAILLKFS